MRDLKAPAKKTKNRENRRKQQKAPRDWRKLLHLGFRGLLLVTSSGLLVGGAVLCGRMLLDWGYFQVEQVRVENQQRVSREDILALSNIELGVSIFELDLKRIGRKIEENPWIASAEVSRLFPREVVIRVGERIPRAILSLDYLYYVDGGGEIFKLLDGSDSLDMPVITGLSSEQLQSEGDLVRRRLQQAVALLDDLSRRQVLKLGNVSEIHVDSSGEFELVTVCGGVPIRLGYGGFVAKLDRLERVFAGLQPQLMALKYIDLNVADRVIVRVDRDLNVGKG